MLFSPKRDASPQMFGDIDADLADLRIIGQEMIDELLREFFDLFDGVKLGERIDGVLDGVGRQDAAIVAGAVTTGKFALELHAYGELFEVVPILHAADFDEAYMRRAVIVFEQRGGHRL